MRRFEFKFVDPTHANSAAIFIARPISNIIWRIADPMPIAALQLLRWVGISPDY